MGSAVGGLVRLKGGGNESKRSGWGPDSIKTRGGGGGGRKRSNAAKTGAPSSLIAKKSMTLSS